MKSDVERETEKMRSGRGAVAAVALLAVIAVTFAACGAEEGYMGKYYGSDTKIEDVKNDPVFGDYGRLIFPSDRYYDGTTLGDLRMLWYYRSDPAETVRIADRMREEAASGMQIFYDIYTDAEKSLDPTKEDTGLFFFRGRAGAPFAIVCAGGGWAYVAAMQDSFPQAQELSEEGFNAFAVIYRPGPRTAYEDLARAISFVFSHAEELGVSTDGYSLWGGSAGARMAAALGSYGAAAFGGDDVPGPSAVVMQYTGHSDYNPEGEPPTFACVGDRDHIADADVMRARIDALDRMGVPTEFYVYRDMGHGFGPGIGTAAEGWFDRAVEFWRAHGGA